MSDDAIDTDTAASSPTVEGRPTPDDGADQATATRSWRLRRPDRTMVVMLLVLGVGILLVIRGLLVGITGDERANLPPFIESVDPVPEAVQVPNQSNVFVDLDDGFTGVLVIDGVEIATINVDEISETPIEPGQQVDLPPVTRFEPGNNTLTFTPSQSAPITQFVDGEHTAEVIYWRVEDGRQFARSFTWTFTVV